MSKYIYNRILNKTMNDIIGKNYPVFSGLIENPVDKFIDTFQAYKALVLPYLDKRFQKNSYMFRVRCMEFLHRTLYIYSENKGKEEFPLVQLVLVENYYHKTEKIKEISPSYIRDLDDFKHYFQLCVEYLFDIYKEDQRKIKEAKIEERKYKIGCDDFEEKVNTFLEQIKECMDESGWTSEPVCWEDDMFLLYDFQNDNPHKSTQRIHQHVSFKKNDFEFKLNFSLTENMELIICDIAIPTYSIVKSSYDENEICKLEHDAKTGEPSAFIKWQKYFLDNVNRVVW